MIYPGLKDRDFFKDGIIKFDVYPDLSTLSPRFCNFLFRGIHSYCVIL